VRTKRTLTGLHRLTQGRRSHASSLARAFARASVVGGRALGRAGRGEVRRGCENRAMDSATAPGTVAAGFAARRRAWEEDHLSPLAARSYPARRAVQEPDCALRTPLQRDRDRIVHGKAFRRLKHKTQVFVAPEGDHYRTRMTHTLEVTQIARTVARALCLNEDLAEAIGLGHDLGHPPFGHIGEAVIDACLRERFASGFRHFEHSLRTVDVLERGGAGLNLCESVRDGILCHSGRAPLPATLEGRIVRVVDRIAYINHDIDDAVRAGVLDAPSLPADAIAVLGETGSARIDTLVHDLVEVSEAAGDIVQGAQAGQAMATLRSFMFDHVYLGEAARQEHSRIERVLRTLFDHYASDPALVPDGGGAPGADHAQRITDYLAGMTDRYAVRAFSALSVPASFAP
jgi:dGTPase